MSEIRLITCVGVEHDLALLPHFLEYYNSKFKSIMLA